MGIYECIYDCNEGDEKEHFCVTVWCSWDPTDSACYPEVTCAKHIIKVGNKFQYNFTHFFAHMVKKGLSNKVPKNVQNVEIMDFRTLERTETRRAVDLVRLKVQGFDASVLNDSKKVTYSQFDDVQSWEVHGEDVIFTLVHDNNCIVRKVYDGRPRRGMPMMCYNWSKHRVEPYRPDPPRDATAAEDDLLR